MKEFTVNESFGEVVDGIDRQYVKGRTYFVPDNDSTLSAAAIAWESEGKITFTEAKPKPRKRAKKGTKK